MLGGGCLEPQPERSPPYSSYVMAADARIPRLEDDPAAAKKLDANDGLGATIPLHTAYEAGQEVHYWDLGTLTATTLKPMYIFRRPAESAGDLSRDVGHPDLIDSIPGDTAYSPLRQIFVVYINASYAGERITSIRALEDAVEIGIVSSPQPVQFFVDCVVTLSTVQLQTSEDGSSMGPQDAFYKGKLVKQFCIGGLVSTVGAIALKDNTFTPGNAYLLRHENEGQPLDEGLLKQDLNEDGDLLDTNTVYDSKPLDAAYTSIWRSFDVVVQKDFKLGDAKTESDLFDRLNGQLYGKGKVVSYRDTGAFLNRPIMLEGSK